MQPRIFNESGKLYFVEEAAIGLFHRIRHKLHDGMKDGSILELSLQDLKMLNRGAIALVGVEDEKLQSS